MGVFNFNGVSQGSDIFKSQNNAAGNSTLSKKNKKKHYRWPYTLDNC